METHLDPPVQNILVQAEAVLAQEVQRLFGRVEDRVLLFQPAVLRQETEHQYDFVFCRLLADLLRRRQRFGTDLAATAVQRAVGIDPDFALLGKRQDHADVEIQAVAETHGRQGQVHRFFRRNFKAVHKVAEAEINRRSRYIGTPKDIFTAHRKQEGLQIVVLAHGDHQAQLVKREAAARTMVNQIQTAALPRLHLGKNRTDTVAVTKIFLYFLLDEGIIQQPLLSISMGMHVAKHGLGHTLKKFAQS